MTYSQAIQFLYDLRWFGTKLGLDNTVKLAELAGNPHHRLRFIHVAGTNGKGSTCAMLESICRSAGLRVGLYTSPHLISFRERIQVNRHLIDEGDLVQYVSRMQELLTSFPSQASPTFFEVVTVIAMSYFAEQKCDLVIWETGMGGRLDATNIVTPLASVITNVDLDHQQWLGETVEKIAFEKAGIIKAGLPVISTASPQKGLGVIREIAEQHGSPLTLVDKLDTERPPLDKIKLPLAGRFQRLNAAVALKTLEVLSKELPVPKTAVMAGLSTVQWPGRMQRLVSASGQHFLLDGAHNPGGIEVLCTEIQKQFPTPKPAIIFGVLRDKDWKSMASTLASLAGRMFLTPVKSERSLPPEELVPLLAKVAPELPLVVCASLAEAFKNASDDPRVVITGSLYLVGEAMELLQISAIPEQDERLLNEYSPAVR